MYFLCYMKMSEKTNKNKVWKWLAVIVIVLSLVGGGTFAYFYKRLNSVNILTADGKNTFVNIPENTTVDEVVNMITERAEVRSVSALKQVIDQLNYNIVRSGHYVIRSGMTNKQLVQMLQRGLQTPVRVTLNNIRTKEQLAGVLSRQLMPDSVSIIRLLNDKEFLAQYGVNPDNVAAVFIPDTYEFFWNVDSEAVFERFYKEYLKFWTAERMQQAAAIPLSPMEVSILASIVEEETNKAYEYPIVAGLYINRLKRGMLLQADPTVKFAVGDFAIRRVLNEHLQTDSPYNTYKYGGLPPGPIRIPSKRVIDAVLNYEKHNYLYMAAKETLNGEHNFAATLSEHNRNAQKYRRALNERRIYR